MGSASGSQPLSARQIRERLPQAFGAPLPPTRPSIFYLFGLLCVTGAMLLLPLIYLGVMVLIGYGLHYHVSEHAEFLLDMDHYNSPRLMVIKWILFFAPVIMGVVLLVFMIRPLVVSLSTERRVFSLSPSKEPLLFDFLHRLCMVLGAPKPARIDVDLDVNASAQLRRGVLSLFGNDLVLTIGLPLVAGLSLREFAGVMAHEFGHFRQGLAMRLHYLNYLIRRWFYRVAYDEDRWEESIQDAGEIHGFLIIGGFFTGLFMLVVRGITWVLLWLASAISGYMSRQMEFDADAQAVRVAGSAAIARLMLELHYLGTAASQAQRSVKALRREGRLPDDLVTYIVGLRRNFPAEALRELEERVLMMPAGWFATHPADSIRIERARAADEPGRLQLEGPASSLFSDFETFCREMTQALYRRAYGVRELAGKEMVSAAKVASFKDDPPEDPNVLHRFFAGLWVLERPLSVRADAVVAVTDPEETINTLHRVRASITQALPRAHGLAVRFNQAAGVQDLAAQAQAMLEAGFEINPRQLDLPHGTLDEVQARAAEAAHAITKHGAKLEQFDAAQVRRLHVALSLLSCASVQAHIPEAAQLLPQVQHYLALLAELKPSMERLNKLDQQNHVLEAITGNLRYDDRVRIPHAQIRRITGAMRDQLFAIKTELDRTPYPFKYLQEGISIGQFVLANLPGETDIKGIQHASKAVAQRLGQFYLRLLYRCVEAAEQVETAIGLGPIEVTAEQA